MTACQTPAQSLSATPLATSYPTTPFSLPPHATTKSLTYRPTLSIFSLYDKVLRRPVEPAAQSGHSRHCNNLSAIGGIADIRPGSPASMTVGNMRANGVRTLAAWCRGVSAYAVDDRRTLKFPHTRQ